MPPSRTFAAALAAVVSAPLLTLTASVPASAGQTVSQAEPTTVLAPRVRQKAKLFMHPQIADKANDRTRSAAKAKVSMTAQFKPKLKKRPVVLQRKKGRRWDTIDKSRQNGQGRAEFNAPYKKRGKVQVYRVVAQRHDGYPAKASRKVSAGKWTSRLNLDTAFSGTSLDANWAHRSTGTYAENEDNLRKCAKSDPGQIRVGGGAARLSVDVDPQGRQTGTDLLGQPTYDKTCEVDGKSYRYRLTGHATTQGRETFQYGYAAARIKVQKEAGQHAAFWMMPAQGGATNGTEIDVMEWFGVNSGQQMQNHVRRPWTGDPDACGKIGKLGRFGKDWWAKYHVFSVEWTKRQYVFRIDGKETCRTRKLIAHTPEYLILSLQANTYELENADTLPQHMYVDWVRFWDRYK